MTLFTALKCIHIDFIQSSNRNLITWTTFHFLPTYQDPLLINLKNNDKYFKIIEKKRKKKKKKKQRGGEQANSFTFHFALNSKKQKIPRLQWPILSL